MRTETSHGPQGPTWSHPGLLFSFISFHICTCFLCPSPTGTCSTLSHVDPCSPLPWGLYMCVPTVWYGSLSPWSLAPFRDMGDGVHCSPFPCKHSPPQLPGLSLADSWVFPHMLSSTEGGCLHQSGWCRGTKSRCLASMGDISDKSSQLPRFYGWAWLSFVLLLFPLPDAASLTPLYILFLRVLPSRLPADVHVSFFPGDQSYSTPIHPLGLGSHFMVPSLMYLKLYIH